MSVKVTPPFDRKVTASNVAQRAGVSKWTVSRAFTPGASISPVSRERVLQAAEELGYRPNLLARSLSKKRTHLVGLVVDEMANPNLMGVLDRVTTRLQQAGYMATVLNISVDYDLGTALSTADQFQVDGVIFLGTVLPDQLVDEVRKVRHLPLIVLYRNSDLPDIQVVATDGHGAGREIGILLANQGYRHIGYMAGPVSESTQLRRLEGFSAALDARGLAVTQHLQADHYSRELGFTTLARYLDRTPPGQRVQALFCENDILAIGAIDALRVAGIEGSMAVVGFDDIELAASPSYALTTYRQPLEVLVDEAIARLEKGNPRARKFLAPGQLKVRQSHLTR